MWPYFRLFLEIVGALALLAIFVTFGIGWLLARIMLH
jgi:hypothetical protein